MVPIPAGSFRMGDDEYAKKAGQVAVEAFCMDRTEVTTAAYAACVSAGKCTRAHTGSVFASCNAGVSGRENHPINCVDRNQADAYCQAQGLRLPTEEEWEYAATGGDGRT
ncbi:MAG: SUMF1/EgtB/PvdO family nonheme iron enzyme, partial [Deltaproteobacteria bacterium]|nr:SUMF1/EgtB/PvdO family nonheme iron enzyme [Deltaproteobacteria bacterium]